MAVLTNRDYVAVQVTLTAANTNYNLQTLVNAALAGAAAVAPGACREFNLQAHPGIDGSGGNTNDILIGDADLSTTYLGYILQPGASRTYRSDFGNAQNSVIYVRSAGTGQKLNVELMR
jgi:hypothetical protein